MTVIFTRSFIKQYRKAPAKIQRKFDKQLDLLVNNPRYPSVGVKKMVNKDNVWEGRVDIHWRFTFEKHSKELVLRSLGTHDIYRK